MVIALKKLTIGVLVVVISIIVALAFTVAPTGFFGASNNENVIKIGVIVPLTGGPSQWGKGALNMITIVADEVNAAGGINGKKIILIPEDGKCSPKEATDAFNKLVNVDGVKVIFGGGCSSECAALAPLLQEKKVFGLANTSTATGIFDDCNYCFRTSPPGIHQAEKIADIAFNKYKIKSVVLLTEQGTYSVSLSSDFITAFTKLGGKIVGNIEFGVEQNELQTELLKVKSSGAEAVFVSTQSPKSSLNIAKQMQTLNINMPLMGGSVFVNKGAFANSGITLPESAFSANISVDTNNLKMKALLAKYNSLYGEIPYDLFFVSASYDGAQMLVEALRVCGEDSSCLADYFRNIKDWQGASATFNFDKHGDPILSNWKEIHIIKGETVFVD